MDDQQPPPDPGDTPVPLDGCGDDPARLLTFARDRHRDQVRAQRDVFLAAAAWADLHCEDTITEHDWATGSGGGGQTAKPVAGAGCPLVAEFAVAEYAAVLGRSTDSGRRLIGQAVETRHRLPHLWTQVSTGTLEAWKAGQIAEATMPLSQNAAAFVDTHIANCAHKIGATQVARLIAEAITRYDPDLADHQAKQAADQRSVNLRFAPTSSPGAVGGEGTVALDGVLDYADARDLHLALRHAAADLADLGSTETLDVRRAQALGVLARNDLTLDLTPDPDQQQNQQQDPAAGRRPRRTPQPAPPEPAPGLLVKPATKTPVKSRQVIIYAHLSADTLTSRATTEDTGSVTSCDPGCDLARVEGHGWVTADQVRSWCGPETQVTVKPVIDTTDCISVDAYEIPDRLHDQVIARDPVCVFPWCHRPARTADCDHITAHAAGGPTCSRNLAPLCRRHHRLKTHTGWTYDTLDTATYLWTSPHGHRFRRDPTGTTPLGAEP